MRVNELYVLFCSVLLDFNGVGDMTDMYSSKMLLENVADYDNEFLSDV